MLETAAAWMKVRQNFYSHPPHKITESVALNTYMRAFSLIGYDIVNTVMVPCYSDVPRKENYAFRVALEIVKS